ncbi:MAG: hypothetical protein KAU58_04170, partial [Candidatus Omnitrophica bacterium]|nr:hypothetical protein [Candidatus Omnitrophota bacterium]
MFKIDRELVRLSGRYGIDIQELIQEAITESIKIRGPDAFKGIEEAPITIALLDKSQSLFEDHRKNNFIGINKALFDRIANRLPKEALEILLITGITHELRHEAGEIDEEVITREDIRLTISLTKQKGVELNTLITSLDLVIRESLFLDGLKMKSVSPVMSAEEIWQVLYSMKGSRIPELAKFVIWHDPVTGKPMTVLEHLRNIIRFENELYDAVIRGEGNALDVVAERKDQRVESLSPDKINTFINYYRSIAESENGPRKLMLLRIALALHDIGKVEGKGEDTFASLAHSRPVMEQFEREGIITNDEARLVLALIFLHDTFNTMHFGEAAPVEISSYLDENNVSKSLYYELASLLYIFDIGSVGKGVISDVHLDNAIFYSKENNVNAIINNWVQVRLYLGFCGSGFMPIDFNSIKDILKTGITPPAHLIPPIEQLKQIDAEGYADLMKTLLTEVAFAGHAIFIFRHINELSQRDPTKFNNLFKLLYLFNKIYTSGYVFKIIRFMSTEDDNAFAEVLDNILNRFSINDIQEMFAGRIPALDEINNRFRIPLRVEDNTIIIDTETLLNIYKFHVAEAADFEEIKEELLERIAEESSLINAFRDTLPQEMKDRIRRPIPSEFAQKCIEDMFTEGHVKRYKEKLYGEIFELWQLFQLAQTAKNRGEETYCITLNDAKRATPDGGFCAQIMVATPNRAGSEENITQKIADNRIEQIASLNLIYEDIALSLYKLRGAPRVKEALSEARLDALFKAYSEDTENTFERKSFVDEKYAYGKAVEACRNALYGLHRCDSNGIPGGIGNGLIWNYTTSVEKEELSLEEMRLRSTYRIGRRNVNQERIHLNSMLEPYLYRIEKQMEGVTDDVRRMLETNQMIIKGILKKIKLERKELNVAMQLKEASESVIKGLHMMASGATPDKKYAWQNFINMFIRLVTSLDKGYEIGTDEIEFEQEKFFKCFHEVKSELTEETEKELADKILSETMDKIRKHKCTARFLLREWLEGHSKAADSEEKRKSAERIINEICLKLDLEEIIIENIDKTTKQAREQGTEVIVVSKELIRDELILRVLNEKYGIRAFVCCYGSPQEHTGLLTTATGAFLLVDLPEIVFDKLAKTGANASLFTSDTGFESYFYIGPAHIEWGIETLSRIITSSVLKEYYEKKERERAEDKAIAETLDSKREDRTKIPVYGNINLSYHLERGDFDIQEEGILEDLRNIYRHGANGVALGRTEYIYIRESPLDFKAQRDLYLGICDFDERPIVLRTFDKRDDKECMVLPMVGSTYSFDYYRTEPGKNALETQVKAMLVAYALSKHKNLGVMFPMVKTMEDISFISEILEKVKEEIMRDDKTISRETLDEMPIGIMVEHPDILPRLEEILDNKLVKISFLSVGTNDLIANVKKIRRALLRSHHFDKEIMGHIERIVELASERGLTVTVCGDAARFPKTVLFSIY